MRALRLSVLAFALASVAFACSAPTDAEGTDESEIKACEIGATRCEGDGVQTCTRSPSGRRTFGPAVACANEGVCKANACIAPTDAQRQQASELASMVTRIRDATAWEGPIDWANLTARGRAAIYRGDGSDRAYFGALFDAFDSVPQGHQGLYLGSGCGKTVPHQGIAQRGACGRPHTRGVVVTLALPGNPLGLSAGDLVVAVKGARSRDVLGALAARPMCTASRPSASNRDATAATTFADALEPGEAIEVESPDGARRTVVVPEGALSGDFSKAISCADPFGRALYVPVESYIRPDGVGVIRLPGFTDPQQQFPGTWEGIEAYRAAFEAKIHAAFEAVKNAPAIVWDVRGNGGGLTQVGLDIASGFPGAQSGAHTSCTGRLPQSSPPAFGTEPYATYALAPGGAFAYAGKVAVLVDGLDYSAADYFPLFAKEKTSALLVGAPTAGAFGATSETFELAGPPLVNVSIDSNRCARVQGNVALEGKSVEPHVAVDYEPQDLARGIDTVLERAVVELSKR